MSALLFRIARALSGARVRTHNVLPRHRVPFPNRRDLAPVPDDA